MISKKVLMRLFSFLFILCLMAGSALWAAPAEAAQAPDSQPQPTRAPAWQGETFRIHGTVAGGEGLRVKILKPDGQTADYALVRKGGVFISQPLPAGDYILRVVDRQERMLDLTPSSHTLVKAQDALGGRGYDLNLMDPIVPAMLDAAERLAPAKGLMIYGTVSDGGVNQAGCEVAIYNAARTPIRILNEFEWEEDWVETTDGDGKYEFAGLAAGTYYLRFTCENFAEQYYNGKWNLGQADPVTVTTGDVQVDVTTLSAGFSLSGNVSGADAPVVMDRVRVNLYDYKGDYIKRVTTGLSGDYEFSNLPAGKYFLWFRPQDYESKYMPVYYPGVMKYTESTPLVITDSNLENLDVTLPVGGSIAGTLTAADTGLPLEDVNVNAYNLAYTGSWQVQTDVDGNYLVNGLPAGEYILHFWTDSSSVEAVNDYAPAYYNGKADTSGADRVILTEGEEKTGIDSDLVKGGKISGIMKDELDIGVVGIVYARTSDSCGPTRDLMGWTDSDGNYTIRGVPEGTYQLYTQAFDMVHINQTWQSPGLTYPANTLHVAAGEEVPGIDFTLLRGGNVSGTVDWENGGSLEDLEIYFFNSAGLIVNSTYADLEAKNFDTYSPMPAGDYRVGFYPRGTYATQYYNDKATLAGADVISVTAGATTTNVNAFLHALLPFAGTSSISGSVTLGGVPAENAVDVSLFQENGTFLGVARTDGGEYSFTNLTPGNYILRADSIGDFFSSDYNWYVSTYHNGKYTLAEAAPLALAVDENKTDVDFDLPLGGKIGGMLFAADSGDELSDSGNVLFFNSDGYQVDNAYIGSGYLSSPLAPGSYRLYSTGIRSYTQLGYCYFQQYLDQYYGGSATLNLATPVEVTAGLETKDINATILPGEMIAFDDLFPTARLAGDGSFTLVAEGWDFFKGMKVYWKGKPLATTYVNSRQLRAVVPAAYTKTPGAAEVWIVRKVGKTVTRSNSMFFTVRPRYGAGREPQLTRITPSRVRLPIKPDGTYTTYVQNITLTGKYFTPQSYVLINGERETRDMFAEAVFIDARHLSVEIFMDDEDEGEITGGTFLISVFTPGIGTSNVKVFTITNPKPKITGLSTQAATVGTPFDLYIDGYNFLVGNRGVGSVVKFKGRSMETSMTDGNQLMIHVPADLLKKAGRVPVVVVNPGPGGGSSNTFYVKVTK